MHVKTIALVAASLSIAPGLMRAQVDFKLAGRNVQVHSFASQGFGYTNQNNYLTLDTSRGSFAMTDGGINASMQFSDRFRIGAQVYDRNIGKLGNFRPELDWAVADYRFRDWFGIRGGKVKTMLGLNNDTQDMEFLHTWALLPQSVYPMDVRGDMISHLGTDLYGAVNVKKMGSFAYTLYGGKRLNDPNGGYVYSLDVSTQGIAAVSALPSNRHIDSYGGPVYGADLRWTTPLKGVTAGMSFMRQDITTKGYFKANNMPYQRITWDDDTTAYYIDYTIGNLRLDGEYRRDLTLRQGTNIKGTKNLPFYNDMRMGYVSAAYRFTKRLELGTYHSRYYPHWPTVHSLPANHIFDQTVTARIDVTKLVDLKVEGHFIDGAATLNSVRGFYTNDNPNGIKPTTRLFIVRLGFHI